MSSNASLTKPICDTLHSSDFGLGVDLAQNRQRQVLAQWSSPCLVDDSKRSVFFEVNGADVAKISMATFSVIEHFDVLEQIGFSFFHVSMTDPNDAFALEETEEAFNGSIVVAVTGTAHGTADTMLSKLTAEIIA